jgi:hypothetical protein
MVDMEPVGDSITMPTQGDLDRRFAERQAQPAVFPSSGFSPDTSIPLPMTRGRPLFETMAARTGMLLPEDVGVEFGTVEDPGMSPLDRQAGLLALQQEVLEGRAGPMTGGNRAAEVFMPAPAAATELNLPAFRNLTAPSRGAGLATGLRAAADAGPLPLDPRIVDAEGALRGQLIEMGIPTGEVDMEAEARRSAEEVAAARDAAGITQSRATPFGSEEDVGGGAGAGAGVAGGGAGGGAGAASSYEQELMNMLSSREKAAQQDKWLALAQVGLNMMASTSPTLLGAVGEAGIKGVEAVQSARDQYDQDRMSLLGQLEQSRQARAAAAARAAGGASGESVRDIPAGALDIYDAEIEGIDQALLGLGGEVTPEQELELVRRRDALVQEKSFIRNAYLSQFGISPSGASPGASSGVFSMDDVTQ